MRDAAAVEARAAELAAAGRVQYWIVVSYQEGLDLLAGRPVPAGVRAQLLSGHKRGLAESADEYAARIKEAE